MDVLTEKEVKLLVKYQLDEGAIFLLRLSYYSDYELHALQQVFRKQSDSANEITVTKWTEIFPGRAKFIHTLFHNKSTNFTEFIQLCIFFSNIDDELLSACSLMLVPNVNYNKITVQDLNKLIGILEADRRYKPNLVFPLFQVYDKSQKGYLTYDEYMTFADKNRSIFDIMIQFRYAITTLMFTPAHWEIMNEKVQSLEFILTYKHEHGKFPPLSPCRYIQWIKTKGPHPYYFDFEPVTEDVGKEQKFALASYLIQFGENIMECLEIILEQQHTYVWDQNKVEETEMNTTATTFTYKPDEKMKYSTVTTARNRYKKSIIVPEDADNVITVVNNETPK